MSTTIQLLRSSSLPMLVQEELERLIVSAELAPGSRINESDLAQRFGVSRGPIREALSALEEAGLVRIEKNRGAFVAEVSLEEADEIYELREALEEVIGRRVVERADPAFLAELRGLVEEMRASVSARLPVDYALVNLRFHQRLLEHTGSRRLIETYGRLVKVLHLFRTRSLAAGGVLELSVIEHQGIVDAIASGDPARAGRVLREHAAASRSRMHKAYQAARGSASG